MVFGLEEAAYCRVKLFCYSSLLRSAPPSKILFVEISYF